MQIRKVKEMEFRRRRLLDPSRATEKETARSLQSAQTTNELWHDAVVRALASHQCGLGSTL